MGSTLADTAARLSARLRNVAFAKIMVDHRGVIECRPFEPLPEFRDEYVAIHAPIYGHGYARVRREPRCLFELVTPDGDPVFSGVMAGKEDASVTRQLIERGASYAAPELVLHPLGEWPKHQCCKPKLSGAWGEVDPGVTALEIHGYTITEPRYPDGSLLREQGSPEGYGIPPGHKMWM